MSHAVRHVARRIARAVATSTPRTRTPVAETGARPRPFSRVADGSPAGPGAPLGVAPPGAPSPTPGPRGPGDGEQRKGFVSWPGLAFLIAAPVAYYLSGGTEDVGEEARRPVQASATKESSAADASKPERTKATTPKEETRAEATEEEEDVDVFRAAAELLARDLDPAPEGAEKRVEESKAERKERRRAEKRARRVADRGDESGASGPAGAARARALANRPDLSEEDKKEEEDGAEAMTAAALVARAFEGAVEVRPRTSTQTFPLASPASFFFSPPLLHSAAATTHDVASVFSRSQNDEAGRASCSIFGASRRAEVSNARGFTPLRRRVTRSKRIRQFIRSFALLLILDSRLSPRDLPADYPPARTPPHPPAQENKEWSATYKAMVYQAEHDADAFRKALAEVKSAADSELSRRTAELAASHAAAAEAAASQIESLAVEMERSETRVAALVEELERFGEEREAAEREADAEREAELARRLEEQAEAHALAIAECLIRERVGRAEALDEIRLKLNGVKEAYDVNGAALRKSHVGVKMSLAVFALQSKVSNGDPFHEELRAVAAVASNAMGADDPGRALVDAVVGSIPEAVARSGVPTAGRLRDRLDDVRRAARRLSLVPETGGGIVAHLVAYLASWLRMSEPGSGWGTAGGGGDNTTDGGVEAAVAAARASVASDRLDAAAAALEEGTEGTAAARAVAGWVADARERQRLEMAVSVLRSHAAAAAASLV